MTLKQQLEQVIAEMQDDVKQANEFGWYSVDEEVISKRVESLSAIVEQMEMDEFAKKHPDIPEPDAYAAPQVPDAPKLSDAKELNDLLLAPDPSWDAWKRTIQEKYWARYDLSAAKLGWSAAKAQVPCAKWSTQSGPIDPDAPLADVPDGLRERFPDKVPDGMVLVITPGGDGCKSPGECKKQGFCMDGWHCTYIVPEWKRLRQIAAAKEEG